MRDDDIKIETAPTLLQREHPAFNVRVAPGGFGIVIERKERDDEEDLSDW